jgi:hypothetical protein
MKNTQIPISAHTVLGLHPSQPIYHLADMLQLLQNEFHNIDLIPEHDQQFNDIQVLCNKMIEINRILRERSKLITFYQVCLLSILLVCN